MWRTLTMDEWDYLFRGRNNSNNKFAPATVNDVHGFVVLSDVPLDTTSLPFNSVSDGAKGWNSNIYTKAQWLRMEKTGAVFLPAAGERYNGNKVKNCGTTGSYWTTSAYRMKNAYYILFSEQNLSVEMTSARYNGFSVRPVLQ